MTEHLDFRKGNVFDGESLVLMNPCNCETTLYWGTHVSGHIFWNGGKEVREQRKGAGYLNLGEYCLTSGGLFKHKHILHIAVHKAMSLDMRYLLKITKRIEEETLRKALDSICLFCEEYDFDKIDIPNFWGGTNGWNNQDFINKFGEHRALDVVTIYNL